MVLVQNNVKEGRKRKKKGVGSIKCRHTWKQPASFLNGITGEWNSYISFNSVPVVHIGELSLGLWGRSRPDGRSRKPFETQ